MRRLRSSLNALFVVAVAAAAGCEAKMYPVSGVVKVDGVPFANGSVNLVPVGPGRPAYGGTDANGRFMLETGNTPGAPKGTYKLVLQKYERSADVAAPIQVRVVMGKMAEVDATQKPIGVMETLGVNSFAYLRAFLVEKYHCLAGGAFRFSVNHLGIISLKQEIDLGPIGAVLKALAAGKGTAEEPFELLVVD